MTDQLFEQLEQIANNQPVKAGNLIHKQSKEELVKKKWIILYDDGDIFGYTLTDLGNKIYGAKLISNKSALSGIGGIPNTNPTHSTND